jgi:hypothetical protein
MMHRIDFCDLQNRGRENTVRSVLPSSVASTDNRQQLQRRRMRYDIGSDTMPEGSNQLSAFGVRRSSIANDNDW